MEELKKLLEYVRKEEDRYCGYTHKAMHEGKMQAYLIHQAEASAFQRVRYIIEEMLEGNVEEEE